jgi:hypothetical protein
MKKYIIVAFLIGILTGFAIGYGYLLSTILTSPSDRNEEMKIGAYYYIWWGPLPPNGTRNHWNESIKGTPFLGKYNSNDSTIADQHILFAKQHGIDFFAVSWIGKGNWLNWDFDDIDSNLENGLLKAHHLQNFSFCLFYETALVMNTSTHLGKNFTKIFAEDMNYSLKYLTNPSYLRINGDPVLFIYNIPYLYEHAQDQNMTVLDVHQLFDCIRQQLATMGVNLYIIGDMGGGPSPDNLTQNWLYSMNATTSYFFDPGKQGVTGWNEVLEDARTYYPEWREVMNSMGIKFIANAYPGFNNTGLAGVVNSTELPNDATMFQEMLKIAINYTDSDLKMVMVTSWNEWLESTAIEPSMENGELFLHTIYDVVPEFPSGIFLLLFMILTVLVVLYSKKKFVKIKK